MITVILSLLAFVTGLIIGYRAYETNLKREGWIPAWDWDKPTGEGRLTMIEPAERMTPPEMIGLLEKITVFPDSDQAEEAYQEMVRNFIVNRKGHD